MSERDRREITAMLPPAEPWRRARLPLYALGDRHDDQRDETIALFDVVAVSAGIRGTQMLVAPADYLRATAATVGAIASFGRASPAIAEAPKRRLFFLRAGYRG